MAFLYGLVLLSLCLVSPSVQVCAPDCTGVDSGMNVKDPADYTRYYICLDVDGSGTLVPSIDSVACPPNTYFNDAQTWPKCDPVEDTPGIIMTSTCDPCKPHCSGAGHLTPHPTDCSTYYLCTADNHVIEYHCGSGLYYNYITGFCSDDDKHCYSYCDSCKPHCTSLYERVADPYDCTSFYLCILGGLSHFKCPYSMLFNEKTRLCEVSMSCSTHCV